jgi:hypothetical protein
MLRSRTPGQGIGRLASIAGLSKHVKTKVTMKSRMVAYEHGTEMQAAVQASTCELSRKAYTNSTEINIL